MILSQLSQPLSQLTGPTVFERQNPISVNHSVTTVTSVRAFSFWRAAQTESDNAVDMRGVKFNF
jgi:hypothetical protein